MYTNPSKIAHAGRERNTEPAIISTVVSNIVVNVARLFSGGGF